MIIPKWLFKLPEIASTERTLVLSISVEFYHYHQWFRFGTFEQRSADTDKSLCPSSGPDKEFWALQTWIRTRTRTKLEPWTCLSESLSESLLRTRIRTHVSADLCFRLEFIILKHFNDTLKNQSKGFRIAETQIILISTKILTGNQLPGIKSCSPGCIDVFIFYLDQKLWFQFQEIVQKQ